VAGRELSGTTGQYVENGRIVEPAPRARDDALARRLWQESERLTGLKPGAEETDAAKPAAAGTL